MAFYAVVGGLEDRRSGGAFAFPDLVRATLERRPGPSEATDFQATDREVKGVRKGVEADGGCAPDAPAGRGDQGNTPSDR